MLINMSCCFPSLRGRGGTEGTDGGIVLPIKANIPLGTTTRRLRLDGDESNGPTGNAPESIRHMAPISQYLGTFRDYFATYFANYFRLFLNYFALFSDNHAGGCANYFASECYGTATAVSF